MLQINPLTLHDCAACNQHIFPQHREPADTEYKMAPEVGLEPTTYRLTAERNLPIELLWN